MGLKYGIYLQIRNKKHLFQIPPPFFKEHDYIVINLKILF